MAKLARLVGANIRRLRRAKGLTQQALGARSGVDFKYLGEVERGDANCTLAVLERVAEALGADPRALLAPEAEAAGRGAPREPDLQALLARLDDDSALFVRDVLASYLASKPERPRRPKKG